MEDGLGYAKKRLIEKIVVDNWHINPKDKQYNYLELLFVIQELLSNEGRVYLEEHHFTANRGMYVFKEFVKLLLYRNLANYDSMILITSEKGCLIEESKIATPGGEILIKDLLNKINFDVYSYNRKSCQLEIKKAGGCCFVKKAKVYEATLRNGSKLIGTYDHPVLVRNKNGKLIYKNLGDLWGGGYSDKVVYISYRKGRVFEPHYKGARWDNRIETVKYIGIKKVYDVYDVQDNHNFIANGFIVSNTGKSSAAIMIAREWCRLIGIKFDAKKHIAYNNSDVMTKIDTLPKFSPIICDEAVRFAAASDWARRENKDLKKKLAQVRTKHMLYILCFPLKINKLEKNYLESFTNYWCVRGDTKVNIDYNGVEKQVNIEHLVGKRNFMIKTYNKKKDVFEFKKARECILTKKNASLFEMELENGKKLRATENHLILTLEGYKKLKDLKANDYVICE